MVFKRLFQTFVLATRFRRYQVNLYHIQIGIMSIVRDADESKTIKMLFDNNAYVLKPFDKP